jgi:radical SAM-linked protein
VKVRLRFTKLGRIRWISHRDVARAWERSLRKAQVPLAYSEGFSPRPRISFGLALPTGAESLAEYLDVDVLEPQQPEGLEERLTVALPEGMEVTGAAPVGVGEPSLQHDVVACRWRVEVPDQPGQAEAVERFLASGSVIMTRQRKGQDVTDDVRPAVLSLALGADTAGTAVLDAELATTTRGLRPSELLGVLGVDAATARIVRTHQWIERDGARREPIPAGATSAPLAGRQAS